ncbi:hypothetical protein [Algihabitans albus]|uniref:hypothetical protein n=1 Tax=Algihabitans albus TaxID=2164067 RepID=UPI000E5CB0D3|nr:hypothetical protein [Algihabitans albus]
MTNALTADPAVIADLLRGLREKLPIAPGAYPLPGPLYACLRRKGRRVDEVWIETGSLANAFAELLPRLEAIGADTLGLCLTHGWRRVSPERFEQVFTRAAQGKVGISVAFDGQERRLAPLSAIASNRSFTRWLSRQQTAPGRSLADVLFEGVEIRSFAARQLHLAPLTGPVTALRGTLLSYGAPLVPPDAFDRAELDRLIEGMTAWLHANLRDDGQLPYKYWPSRGRESDADSPIRRFMATLALIKTAEAKDDTALMMRAAANLQFNLDRFYRSDGRAGLIEWQGQVKLGAVALAALAILEHPQRHRWEEAYRRLSATVDDLHRADGSFRSFLKPAERNDNQNFYPGEALLFWATRLRADPEGDLAARFQASFIHYRAWHRAARSPAFVPWHSQAYALAYAALNAAELRDFVFEMNDWLLPLQQWGQPLAPVFWGRFYDPERPDYGPPHASSTGVYIEGLAAALTLATEASETSRAARYERAIWRAARNLRQLQFKDEVDAFYIQRRPRVLGGLRTEAYNNEIRVDNVQHGLMGLMAVRSLLRQTSLQAAEVACSDR